MTTASFQSHVAAGAVGNSAASMVYAALGCELWAVPTVLYSNHPANRTFAGEIVASALLYRWIAAFEENRLIEQVDYVQSGYLGAADQAQAVLAFLFAARKSGRTVSYACDPVLGDQTAGLYVPPSVAIAIREVLVPAADIVTPNLFELGYLTGAPVDTAAQVWAAWGMPLSTLATKFIIFPCVPDFFQRFAASCITHQGPFKLRSTTASHPFREKSMAS